MPRSRVAAGDESVDRRGRSRTTPAFLSYGFRPFFLGAAIYAAVALPLWLWMYANGTMPAGPFAGSAWHAHEMIFGYLAAVVAGFILTAVPNWTGRLPLSGRPLAVLLLLWLAGRVACSFVTSPVIAMVVDLSFLAVLAGAVWREVLAGKNWRNAPVAALLTAFAAGNLVFHMGNLAPAVQGLGIRIALGVIALLIALIGGRIVPSFTRNWLAKRQGRPLPAPFGRIDQAALAATALSVAGWIAAPDHLLTGVLLAAAGVLLLVRLARWRGLDTWREAIVLVLHLGYFWLAASLLLLGCAVLRPDHVPQDMALHALTAGAIPTMTLAVMTRATLGHTGRPIETNTATAVIYLLVTAGALLRVIAPVLPDVQFEILISGGVIWSLAFGLFAASYGPMLLSARTDQ